MYYLHCSPCKRQLSTVTLTVNWSIFVFVVGSNFHCLILNIIHLEHTSVYKRTHKYGVHISTDTTTRNEIPFPWMNRLELPLMWL
jgi:hypothetical protein